MLKIKTLITYLCSLIISDSVAVKFLQSVNPARKYFAKYDVLLFLRHGVYFNSFLQQIRNNVLCSYAEKWHKQMVTAVATA